VSAIAEPWINLHDRIKPISKPSKIKKPNPPNTVHGQFPHLADLDKDNNLNIQPGLSSKLSTHIDKNSILSEYQASCMKKGILSEVSTVIKGENSSSPPLIPFTLLPYLGMQDETKSESTISSKGPEIRQHSHFSNQEPSIVPIRQ
jgi:hypothetical protein